MCVFNRPTPLPPHEKSLPLRFTIYKDRLLDRGVPVEYIQAADFQRDSLRRPVPFNEAGGHPSTLCIHYTAGSRSSDIPALTRADERYASVQLVLNRDGTFTQLTPLNAIAWHAGDAQWHGFGFGGRTFNWTAIGVEITNYGWLNAWNSTEAWRVENGRVTTPHVPREDCFGPRRHPKGGAIHFWHKYTVAQMSSLDELVAVLRERFPTLIRCVGHDEVSRHKVDPGPAFDMEGFRRKHGFVGL